VRKIREILADDEDEKKDLFLARRTAEFPHGQIRSVLCRVPQVSKLENLVSLSLYGNDLISIGAIGALRLCTHLESLDLGRNCLTHIPDELNLLNSLKHLVLDDNSVTTIGAGILGLSSLKSLRLSNNCIESVPTDFGEHLPFLEVLALDNNEVAEVPASVGLIKALKTLNMRGNSLVSLPETLAELSLLEMLVLSSNKLESFLPADKISNLLSLRTLLLNCNRLHSLPFEEFSQNLQKCRINVANNHLGEITPQVLEALPEMMTFGQVPV